MCLIGVFVLTGQSFDVNKLYGFGFVVISSFFMALSLTLTKKYKNVDMMQSNFLGAVIAAIFCLSLCGR